LIVFENPYLAFSAPLVALLAYTISRAFQRFYEKAHSINHPLADFIENRNLFKRPLIPEILAAITIGFLMLAAANPYSEYRVVEEKLVERVGTLSFEVKPPVVLILDNSGSMGEGGKLEKAKEALIEFTKSIGGRLDIGLIVFDHTVNKAIPPTSDTERLIREIEGIEVGGGTMYSYPLMLAYQWLKPYRDFNVSVYVVFASDGVPADLNEAMRTLNLYREAGIPIYGIFIGFPWEGFDVIKEMSEKTGGEAYAVEDLNKLVEKYREIASTILNKTDVSVKVVMTEKIERTVRVSYTSALLTAAAVATLALYAARYRVYRVAF